MSTSRPSRSRRAIRRMTRGEPRRIAMISVHTSPLDQPGTGDAGGLNVYVDGLSHALGRQGIDVEIFTRATTSKAPAYQEIAEGVAVRHVVAGPFEGLDKNDLPGQLCAFAAEIMHTGARHDAGWYDVIHSHYWLAGQVGYLAADRWKVPLVHSMHTMAKVKNAALAPGDSPEPAGRIIGEQQVVAAADRLIAPTRTEAAELIEMYDAAPEKIAIVPPGVDLTVFHPGSRSGARREVGVAEDRILIVFAGRIQPLKAPDVLVHAVADLLSRRPELRARVTLAVIGGPSGTGLERPEWLEKMVADLGIGGSVEFHPPVGRERLAQWYRAADLVAVPSYSESFGLVAIEAQACGVPVVAARVGGLSTAVSDGVSGLLVDGHGVAQWSRTIEDLVFDDARRATLGRGASEYAHGFGWDFAVDRMIDAYAGAIRHRARRSERKRAR